MGGVTSKKDEKPSSYPIRVRAYAKWDYHSPIIANDTLRCANSEMKNLIKHNRSMENSPMPRKSSIRRKSSQHRSTKKVRFDDIENRIPSDLRFIFIDPKHFQVSQYLSN